MQYVHRVLRHSVAIMVLLLAIVLSAPAFAGWDGMIVKDVRHQPQEQERAMDSAALQRIIPIKIGEPYNSEKIRQSISALYATGRFTDIRVDATAEAGGVVLTFLTKNAYFVGDIRVQGVIAPPSEAQLRNATRFTVGGAFSNVDVPAAEERLRRVLEQDGYFEPQITPSFQPNPLTQQIDIEFEIHTGPRARLGNIKFGGNPLFSPATLLHKAGWKSGEPFTSSLIQNGLQRIRKLYQEKEYLGASVALSSQQFHPETNSADLILNVDAGGRVDVTAVGAPVSRGTLKRLVPVFAEGAFDDELLNEGERNLTDYFQSQGYFDAKVSYSRQERPSGTLIEYEISRGVRQRLKEIRISGNKYFQTDELRGHMKITPAGGSSSRGRFSAKMLEQDLEAIKTLYQNNGFARVEITSALSALGAPSEREMTVSIQISEGPQTKVGSISITGNHSFPEQRLRDLISAKPGKPFSESLVAADRDSLLAFYLDQGFHSAKFDAKETQAAEDRVRLEYVLDEGPRAFVRNIFIDGLQHTRVGVVNRQLQFHEGEELSQSALLDTQRRLYDLGVFNQVQVAIQNPEGAEESKNVLVYVEEARRYTLKVGLGAEVGRFGGSTTDVTNVQGKNEFSPDISVDLSRLNVGGRPHTLTVSSRFSTLQKLAALTYTAPRLLNVEGLQGSARAVLDESRDVRTFTAKREEGSLQLEDRRSKAFVLLYRYAFRRITIDSNTLRISPAEFPILAQPVLVGMVNQVAVRDTRDNPAESHQGMFTSVDLGLAAKAFGSQTEFGRVLVQNSTYYRIGKGMVLARSSQFGFQNPFGAGRTVTLQPSQDGQPAQEIVTTEIPIAEHFFSGGGNSHRGFAVNQAGPRDPVTGFPLGGNALLLNTIELRFPIWGDNIGGVLFHDMGNVFSSISHITLRQHQRNPQDFDYLSHAVGFGLRYRTPVGPIRLDLGYNLNPTRFLVDTGGTATSQSLARWQLLFSIGQTF